MVERFIRTLEAMVSVMVSNNQTDWDQQLTYAMMDYRSSLHESTGMTPNLMMFDREVELLLDVMTELPPDHQEGLETDYVNRLKSRLRIAQNLTRAKLKESAKTKL